MGYIAKDLMMMAGISYIVFSKIILNNILGSISCLYVYGCSLPPAESLMGWGVTLICVLGLFIYLFIFPFNIYGITLALWLCISESLRQKMAM